MKHRFVPMFLVVGCLLTASACESVSDSLIDSAFGGSSYREDRQELYEKKGVDRKRASRMAFEDEVWGGSPTTVR